MKSFFGQDRGNHVYILQDIKTSHAYNIALIGETYVPCCLADLGREFKFPLYFNIGKDPNL